LRSLWPDCGDKEGSAGMAALAVTMRAWVKSQGGRIASWVSALVPGWISGTGSVSSGHRMVRWAFREEAFPRTPVGNCWWRWPRGGRARRRLDAGDRGGAAPLPRVGSEARTRRPPSQDCSFEAPIDPVQRLQTFLQHCARAIPCEMLGKQVKSQIRSISTGRHGAGVQLPRPPGWTREFGHTTDPRLGEVWGWRSRLLTPAHATGYLLRERRPV
jgi:hypothetical protein